MEQISITLTTEEEERIQSLDGLLGDDTVNYIREAEERRLAIKTAEVIYRKAADRAWRKPSK